MFLSVGGRKYLITLLSHAVSTLLLWYGKLDASSYSTIILGTTAAYIAGNTYQKTKGTNNDMVP